MKKIASFSADHDIITAGMYISRIDGDVITYDLRTRKPNGGDYMDTLTIHSVEHMLATFMRNGEIGSEVVYFGPMGCRTGFYLLVRDSISPAEVREALIRALERTVAHEGEVFGASRKECGNYRELSLDAAKKECAYYLGVLKNKPQKTFEYGE
ncbi:MAG: S-ribosylhomocysteine lyase [Clostridia bacterium]|nr:S-ribosylhomocysteine lyase [Clostridia bacterium]MBR6741990.1 S-ribosylhomocysteine lyase [Clostridia bacterium]